MAEFVNPLLLGKCRLSSWKAAASPWLAIPARARGNCLPRLRSFGAGPPVPTPATPPRSAELAHMSPAAHRAAVATAIRTGGDLSGGLADPPEALDVATTSEADHPIVRCHQPVQIVCPGELGAHAGEILLGDLTGPRAGNSDANRNLGSDDLVEELTERRKPDPIHLVDDVAFEHVHRFTHQDDRRPAKRGFTSGPRATHNGGNADLAAKVRLLA